jgi:prepilin-type N-terminal cleavage/methylation domain-containing protein
MRIGRVRGFTLVEMIVAILIAASLGVAVYTAFAQGVRLWARAGKDRGEWKVDLWVEKMTGDLRNSFWDPQCPFKGNRTDFSFATLAHDSSAALMEGSPVYFRYAFDLKAGGVISEKTPFENLLMSPSASKVSVSVLGKVAAFELEYYGYDSKMKAHRWETQWNKDCFPEAVKITIEPEKMNHRKWTRVISMPTENTCLA